MPVDYQEKLIGRFVILTSSKSVKLEQSMIQSPQNILELFKQILDSSDFGDCATLGVGEQNGAKCFVELFRAQPG